MGLSNYQLVLLDNLIYLDTMIANGIDTVGEAVRNLLYANGDQANGTGTGTLQTDCYNKYNGMPNSLMSYEDWEKVLQAIER